MALKTMYGLENLLLNSSFPHRLTSSLSLPSGLPNFTGFLKVNMVLRVA